MQIGIFGGTFNPIHYGHLINAQLVAEEFSLDTIYFIPAKTPVHKHLAGSATNEDRFRMVELACEGNDLFSVNDIEIARETPSYTFLTVRELRRRHPERNYSLIIGLDSYQELHTWYSYEEIIGSVPLIVMKRPGCTHGMRTDIGRHICRFAANPDIQISSSFIRKRIGEGRSIRYLVPASVEHYITQRGIYAS